MKKFLAILLAATSILSFAACGKQQSEVETTTLSDKTTAVTESVVESSAAQKENTENKKENTQQTQLIPFFGGEVNYIDYTPASSGPYETEKGIGLITNEGKVILDCVYSSFCEFTLDDEEWYNMTKTTVRPSKGTEHYTETVETTLIKKDGSERLDLKGYFYGYQDNSAYSCGRFVTASTTYAGNGIQYIYNRNGELIFETPKALGNTYSHIYENDRLWVFSEDSEETIVYDTDGNIIFKYSGYIYETNPADNNHYYAHVGLYPESKHGIVDLISGKWAIDPVYDDISVSDNGSYILEKASDTEYLSPELKKIDKKTAYNSIEKDADDVDDINDCNHIDANGVKWFIDSSETGVKFISENKTIAFDGAKSFRGSYYNIFGDYFAIFYTNDKEVAVTVYSLAEQNEIIKHSFPVVSADSNIDIWHTESENLIPIVYEEDISIASPRYYIIYDLRSGEYLTTKEDNCRRFLLNEADGEIYYSFEYKDRSVVTDENGKVIYEEKF